MKGKAWPEGTQQSDLETLQAELSKIQSTFAEELGSARARLAVAEKRNSDLLEQLQSTLCAASTKMDRPSSLPDPPRSIPSRLVSERSFKDAKDEGKSPQSDDLQRAAWSRQRKQAEQHLWELHSQQKNRSEQLARQQQECQWQQLQSSCRSLSSEGGGGDGNGVASSLLSFLIKQYVRNISYHILCKYKHLCVESVLNQQCQFSSHRTCM